MDSSFPDAQFAVDNFHLWRKDRTAHGGGVAVYLKSQIAGERKPMLEFSELEHVTLEVNLENQKLLFICTYKPPSVKNNVFEDQCQMTIDKITSKYDNIFFLGDLNFDMLDSAKCQPLMNICDTFDLDNIVNNPTCFTVNGKPSLLDVILTNCKSLVFKSCNFSCGLSDVHNIICCQLKLENQTNKTKFCYYRSYKNFDVDKFNHELNDKMSTLDMNGDVNTDYEKFSNVLLNLTDKHAPLKQKKMLHKPVPFMNKALKQAIYQKRMLLNKYNKYKNAKKLG